MAQLGFELLLRFLWGSLVILPFVSKRERSEGFSRIASFVVAGIVLVAVLLAWPGPTLRPPKLIALGALSLGAALYGYASTRWARGAGHLLIFLAPTLMFTHSSFGGLFNFLAGALLIGSVFVGLGFWCTFTPELNAREFQKIVRVIFAALGFKSIEIAFTLYNHANVATAPVIDEMGRPYSLPVESSGIPAMNAADSVLGIRGEFYFGLGTFGILILLTRLLWGILAPVVLSAMVKNNFDTGANQKTGRVLCALCVMVMIGESTALFLHQALGWNL